MIIKLQLKILKIGCEKAQYISFFHKKINIQKIYEIKKCQLLN